MFDGALFFLTCFLTFLIGVILNKGLSSTNTLQGMSEWQYDIPYIFTIGFNEIIVLLYMTIAIFTLFYIKYSKSESSRNQIKEILNSFLKIEVLICSFIVGTWWFTFNLRFLRKIDEGIYIIIILGIIKYSVILYNSNLKKNKFKNDLYEPRESLIKLIDFNIENYTRFSIIGEWGIGKTKLIDNFFKGSYFNKDKNYFYRDKYEQIYIDASAYGNNQKIIEILESELNRSFKEAKILKLDRSLSKEFFNISSNYVDLIKKIFIKEKTLEDSKDSINKKIEEYQILMDKKLVVCIDNLERIDDKERIVNLLSVVDEILSNNITRIYLYEEKHMETLFDNGKFKKYIEKYSESKINVNKIKIEEIIEKNKEVYKLRDKYIKILKNIGSEYIKKLERLKYQKDVKIRVKETKSLENLSSNEKIDREINNIEKEYNETQLEIEEFDKLNNQLYKNLSNPRYLINTEKFISSNYLDYSAERLFEYKLIIDLFIEFNLKNEYLRKIFFTKKTYEYQKKEEELETLYIGKIKEQDETVDGIIEKLKNEALSGEGEEICKYIEFCRKNEILNKEIQKFFAQKETYLIKSALELHFLIANYLDEKINIHFLKKAKIIYSEKFFSEKEKYLKKEARKFIQTNLILYEFKEMKKFIIYIYNRKGKYKQIKKLLKDNVIFEDLLEICFSMTFQDFLKEINLEYKIEKENKSLFFEYIDKYRLKKEFLILNNLKIEEREENQNKDNIVNFLKKYFFEDSTLRIKDYITIKKYRIEIFILGIKKVINRINVEELNDLENMKKNNDEIKEFLMEIYLLNERIKTFEIRKLRLNTEKFKKYFKK